MLVRCAVVGALVLGLGASFYLYRAAETRDHVHTRRLNTQQLARFAEDRAEIADQPLFPESPRTHDAGPHLAPIVVAYDDVTDRDRPHPGPSEPWWMLNPFTLDDWATRYGTLPDGDFTLLTELRAYDYWESGDRGVLASTGARPELADVLAPSYNALLSLARLRLAHALRHPDELMTALSDVRHLANLVETDESFLGTQMALGMLEDLVTAADLGVERGVLVRGADGSVGPAESPDAARLLLPDRAQTVRGRRVLLGWARVQVTGGVPMPERAPFGFCAALASNSDLLGVLGPLETRAWPGEERFTAQIELGAAALTVPGCRIERERQRVMRGVGLGEAISPAVESVPYVRTFPVFQLVELYANSCEAYREVTGESQAVLHPARPDAALSASSARTHHSRHGVGVVGDQIGQTGLGSGVFAIHFFANHHAPQRAPGAWPIGDHIVGKGRRDWKIATLQPLAAPDIKEAHHPRRGAAVFTVPLLPDRRQHIGPAPASELVPGPAVAIGEQ